MNIPLGGSKDGQAEVVGRDGSGVEELSDPIATAKEFLMVHKLAKIVVVIDTHCLDNGAFVYTGDSPSTYQACSLDEVSSFRLLVCALSDRQQ